MLFYGYPQLTSGRGFKITLKEVSYAYLVTGVVFHFKRDANNALKDYCE